MLSAPAQCPINLLVRPKIGGINFRYLDSLDLTSNFDVKAKFDIYSQYIYKIYIHC